MRLTIFFFLFATLNLFSNAMESTIFYISTNDSSIDASIATCELDPVTGEIAVKNAFSGVVSPSYLIINRSHTRLYCVAEGTDGEVAGWEILPEDHSLKLLGRVISGGIHPCYLSLTDDEQVLMVANYSSGTVGVVNLDEQGVPQSLNQTIRNIGSGPQTDRQEASHMHYIRSIPGEGLVFAADLGSDKVMLYHYNSDIRHLEVYHPQPYIKIQPGSGPRHLDFHPNGKWIYLLNELNGSIDTLVRDAESSEIVVKARRMLMPENFEGFNKSAAIRVHPSGRFVYGSNRGDLNSITIFRVLEDGSLEKTGLQSEGIGWPRDFAIDPSGKFLLVACREENLIRVFEIDLNDGTLTNSGHACSFPKPVCIAF